VQAGQGIYYHTAMLNGRANQLSEMVNPGRIYSEVGRFARAGATQFFLVNISDVRPVPLSTGCAMQFVWNAAPYLAKDDSQNMDAFLNEWSRRQFGSAVAAQVAGVYRKYYGIPYQGRAQRRGENAVASRLYDLDEEVLPLTGGNKPLTDAVARQAKGDLAFAQTNRPYVTELVKQAEALAPAIPPERRDFYQAHVLTQAHIHLHLLEMLEHRAESVEAYGAGDKAKVISSLEQALRANDQLFDALHKAEYGKWSRWYIGERFVGLEAGRDRLRRALAEARGEPPPPLRKRHGYPELYQYQERFQTNFPLLYPEKP